ncbi:putative quinol monooxygenase [Prochlorococcus marinus]|uniref:putative quinol monooxygenase n=1 Tax=Prochlorococcus marinus TaxID=1219 RepID=UPI003D7B856C
MIEIPITQARKSLFLCLVLDQIQHLCFLQNLKIKEDKVAEYLEIADMTDKAIEADEPGMLHHNFDQDSDDPLRCEWSEVYKNDDALLAHLANPALGVYLEAHAEIGTDLSVEFYGTVGDKVIEAMKGTGVPYKIF